MTCFQLLRGAAAAAALSAVALVHAQAQAQAQDAAAAAPGVASVVVHAAACPDVQDLLEDALAPIVRQENVPADMTVTLNVSGGDVDTVDAAGGPRAYQRAVRHALRGAACGQSTDPAAVRQLHVIVLDPWGRFPA